MRVKAISRTGWRADHVFTPSGRLDRNHETLGAGLIHATQLALHLNSSTCSGATSGGPRHLIASPPGDYAEWIAETLFFESHNSVSSYYHHFLHLHDAEGQADVRNGGPRCHAPAMVARRLLTELNTGLRWSMFVNIDGRCDGLVKDVQSWKEKLS